MKSLLTFLLTCAIAMSSMIQVGCTPQQELAVVSDIGKFLPAVTNVADAVCAFTPAAPICLGGVAAVAASSKVLQTALQNYFTAKVNGTIPAGVIASLSGAITTFEGDASNILGAVHVVDPSKVAPIEAMAAAAEVLLSIVESLLPPVAPANQLRFTASTKTLSAVSLTSAVTSYNAKVAACEKALPYKKSLKRVHIHNVAMRVVSFGRLT